METRAEQPAAAVVAPDPPRFRWLRRLLIFTVLWAVAMYGVWTWWLGGGKRRLHAEVDALRARGEPVELAQVRPTMPFDHRSAGPDVAAAARMLTEFGRARAITSGGNARRLPAEPSVDNSAPRVAEIFNTAKRAATKPVGPLPSPLLTGMRELSEMLRAAAVRRQQLRHDRESVELIAALLQQAEVTFVSGASVTFHQRGVETRAAAASAAMTIAPGLRIAPQRSESSVTADDVRDLIRRLLDESHMAASFTRAWQAERVYRIYVAQAPVYARSPVVVYRHDMVRTIRQTTELVAASRGASFPRKIVRDVTPPPPPQSALDRWARAASNFHRDRAWSGALFAHYGVLADSRAAAIHLAVKLYALDHGGQPPPTLDALVPAYLPAAPRDPFADDGRAMSYRAGEQLVVVATVGPNGSDAAAGVALDAIRPDRRRVTVRQTIGDDIVYPLVLPAGDATTAPSSR